MKDVIPFKGAVKRLKAEKKIYIRKGKIRCSCGALDEFYTEWAPYHDQDCIIHKKKGKNK